MAAWCWAAGIPDPRPTAAENIPLIIPQLTGEISQMLHDFGFRWHEELQVRWIEGGAGLGTLARIVDKPPRNFVEEGGEAFLAENNPKLLQAIKEATPEKREHIKKELLKNFEQIEKVLQAMQDMEDGEE